MRCSAYRDLKLLSSRPTVEMRFINKRYAKPKWKSRRNVHFPWKLNQFWMNYCFVCVRCPFLVIFSVDFFLLLFLVWNGRLIGFSNSLGVLHRSDPFTVESWIGLLIFDLFVLSFKWKWKLGLGGRVDSKWLSWGGNYNQMEGRHLPVVEPNGTVCGMVAGGMLRWRSFQKTWRRNSFDLIWAIVRHSKFDSSRDGISQPVNHSISPQRIPSICELFKSKKKLLTNEWSASTIIWCNLRWNIKIRSRMPFAMNAIYY